ncbi:MAG: YciI family protein [Magnetospirillum sp.]|nr:YciI family protein [Magnetospirillum sp.]
MLFMFHCTDKAGAAEVRAGNRAAHLDYLEAHKEQIFAAGPLLGDDGASMVGSLLVLDFPDKAAAEAFAANDPYAKAGLFETVEIRAWRRVFPKA